MWTMIPTGRNKSKRVSLLEMERNEAKSQREAKKTILSLIAVFFATILISEFISATMCWFWLQIIIVTRARCWQSFRLYSWAVKSVRRDGEMLTLLLDPSVKQLLLMASSALTGMAMLQSKQISKLLTKNKTLLGFPKFYLFIFWFPLSCICSAFCFLNVNIPK